MGKLIFIALTIALIYYLFARAKPRDRSNMRDKTQKRHEIMLECTHCGTYVSEQESLIIDGKFYCSKECADIH